jgi:putative SOS response-associated peptidase YedK
MCGRFSLKASPDDVQKWLGMPPPPGYRARFNIAPLQEVLTLVADADGEAHPRLLRWGLVPFWAQDPAIGNRMINARAETVAEKPAYRSAFARRRCLVVADGFYEWQPRPQGKQPMRIRLASEAPFTFAGLWEQWGKGRNPLETCTIITTVASGVMEPIHDRMPVILTGAERARWLDPRTPAEELGGMMRPYPGADLEAYPVSTLVNNPIHDAEECLAPVGAGGE